MALVDPLNPIDLHIRNIGIILYTDGQTKDIYTCSCQINHLFRTLLIGEEVIKHGKDPLICYYSICYHRGSRINKLISKALKRDIYGPVIIRYQEKDSHRVKILDYLLTM